MRKSKIIFRIGLLFSIVLLLAGLVLTIYNMSFIEYTTFFGSDKASELSRSAAFLGYAGLDYSNMSELGNKAVVGIVIIATAFVLFLITYLISNNKKLVENSSSQVDILKNLKAIDTSVAQMTISDQIKELANLKEEGILTEEEFSKKKKELLAKI